MTGPNWPLPFPILLLKAKRLRYLRALLFFFILPRAVFLCWHFPLKTSFQTWYVCDSGNLLTLRVFVFGLVCSFTFSWVFYFCITKYEVVVGFGTGGLCPVLFVGFMWAISLSTNEIK